MIADFMHWVGVYVELSQEREQLVFGPTELQSCLVKCVEGAGFGYSHVKVKSREFMTRYSIQASSKNEGIRN